MTLAAVPFRCPKCALSLEPAAFTGGQTVQCSACRSRLTAAFFPAFDTPPEDVSTAPGAPALEGEATCFFHPTNRAALACEGCGRFLCALCDLPLGARHLCAACIGTRKPLELVTSRACWPMAALLAGVLPLLIAPLIWPLLIVTGLIAIFLALWGWRKPGSLVKGPRRWAAVVGGICGLMQIGAVIGFCAFLWIALQRT